MFDTVLSIPFWFEFIAVVTGAISGAMHASRARYDLFGVVCLAVFTGVAGGILRDVLLQDYGIYAFQRPSLIVGCAAVGLFVFYFGKLVTYLDPLIDLLDNVSVACWAVIGAGKGLQAGLGVVPAIIMGTITAIGGGVIRDICMNRQPEVFRAGTPYGSAAFLGAVAYCLVASIEPIESFASIVGIVVVLATRYISLFMNLRTAPSRDYTYLVVDAFTKPGVWWRRFLVKIGARKGTVEDSSTELRNKIRHYEKLRKVWHSPGKTSPLPPVNKVHGTRVVNDAEAEEPQAAEEFDPFGDPGDKYADKPTQENAAAEGDGGEEVVRATGDPAVRGRHAYRGSISRQNRRARRKKG